MYLKGRKKGAVHSFYYNTKSYDLYALEQEIYVAVAYLRKKKKKVVFQIHRF